MKRALAFALVALAACQTVPDAAPSAQGIPDTPLSLGEWRTASPDETRAVFEQGIAARYGLGLPLSTITADLRAAEFSCASPSREANRGAPPSQACRRTQTANNCRHTWQVHLHDAEGDARLARVRALYDRSCGDDGLLGGPGD